MSEETILARANGTRSLRRGSLLLLLGTCRLCALLLTPLATLVGQSFRLFVPAGSDRPPMRC